MGKTTKPRLFPERMKEWYEGAGGLAEESGGSAETTIIVTQQAGNSTGGSIDDMPHIDW